MGNQESRATRRRRPISVGGDCMKWEHPGGMPGGWVSLPRNKLTFLPLFFFRKNFEKNFCVKVRSSPVTKEPERPATVLHNDAVNEKMNAGCQHNTPANACPKSDQYPPPWHILPRLQPSRFAVIRGWWRRLVRLSHYRNPQLLGPTAT